MAGLILENFNFQRAKDSQKIESLRCKEFAKRFLEKSKQSNYSTKLTEI